MQNAVGRIEFPELFFGIVAPIGADTDTTIRAIEKYLKQAGYRVIHVKVTDYFLTIERTIPAKTPLEKNKTDKRITSYIEYGNQIREFFEDDSVLAAYTILRISKERLKLLRSDSSVERYQKTAYILYQFKRKEEIDLLRSVYGRLFFQISVYSKRESRIAYLSKRLAHEYNTADHNFYRTTSTSLILRDENEKDNDRGQRVTKIFHDADFIVNNDYLHRNPEQQIFRFLNLIFSSNSISPTRDEYGMFAAKAAALRTLDLSRQVGAAIFRRTGEIASLGSNEVPKAHGGTYWSDDHPFDAREYALRKDSNDARKRELLREIFEASDIQTDFDDWISQKKIKDSQFMDALEYGRIIHAEMSAITDAARLGIPIEDSTLYCTTFPCHMCAKHIVSSGISRVVFLEPYPKSLASDLHSDSIDVESGPRGEFAEYRAVKFEHFYGVTPRRYRELFERGQRKSKGVFQDFIDGIPRPYIDYKAPFYVELENRVILTGTEELRRRIDRLRN